ncbi:MAG: glycosyltransferase [Actinomycetota bacterium]|nr:glycosyltransferase [Actinomycetota bacterium]
MVNSFSMLSTYPPTQCGLATFAYALTTELVASGSRVDVVRVVDGPAAPVDLVTAELETSDRSTMRAAAEALNACDVAIVQHEYGIFGGPDGADVVDLLDEVRVPIIVVLHTVLANPTLHQHQVLAQVISAASTVVTMTETARRRLLRGWRIDAVKVRVIAHGAADNRSLPGLVAPAVDARPTILTWGLMGEGKGIEWAIPAVADLADLVPAPRYRIVGETHPRVVERDGERYRDSLSALISDLGIEEMVSLEADYLDEASLRALVRDADVVLLPYDSRDQVTSGVLTEAVVAGKPVVSTAFPHAVELLSSGAGILVPQRDPMAIAAALRRVLTEPGLAESMGSIASELAPGLLWSGVAAEYTRLGRSLVAATSLSVA